MTSNSVAVVPALYILTPNRVLDFPTFVWRTERDSCYWPAEFENRQ